MNKRLKTILQYCFFFALGIFFAWLSLRTLDAEKKAQIHAAFVNARHWLIVPVFGMLFLSHLVRAQRWRLLMEPLGYRPTLTNTFFAVMIGYMVNQGVPRLGEVVKCTVLARYEKIPADKLIGTIILERVIDAITLLVIFGITLVIQPELYTKITQAFFDSTPGQEKDTFSSGLITIILIAAVLLAVAGWMLVKKKSFGDLSQILKRIWKSIIQGIGAIRHLKKSKQFVLLTVLLWTLYLSGGYIGFMAFRETGIYGWTEAFTVLSAGSIGMIASPGGIGAYAYLIQKTMQVYGLNEGVALAFGWILWLAQTAVILIGGLISFAAIPYYNKKRNREPS